MERGLHRMLTPKLDKVLMHYVKEYSRVRRKKG